MALILRAAAISPVSRQLRRPGTPAATPATNAALEAAPHTAPVRTDAAPALPPHLPQALPIAAVLPTAPALPEREHLMLQAAQLLRDRQALAAATEQIVQEKQQLADQLEAAQAAQRQLREDTARIKAEAERLGYEQGQELAGREAAEATAAQVARLNAVVQALSQSKRALLEENQDLLVEIAFAAVCRMLGANASSRPALASMVGALIEAERAPETLRVRLHPQDLGLLTEATSGLDPRLEFLPDSGIELGGCMIDGPRGTLDARLELQLQHLRSTLLLVRQQRGQNEAPV